MEVNQGESERGTEREIKRRAAKSPVECKKARGEREGRDERLITSAR